MRTILLIMIGLSTLSYANFTRDNTIGIVTDSTTGLMWQDNIVDSSMTWQSAIDTCEALSLGGLSDWRLPNVNELEGLVDDTRVSPAINVVFQNTASSNYWSSTSYAVFLDSAWYVNFDSGFQNNLSKYAPRYVRCVRAGQ